MEKLMALAHWPLRIVLVLAFVGVTVLQTLSLPGQFRHQAEMHPDDAWVPWPATLFVGFELLCIKVVIVATWVLLRRVRRERILDASAFRWVDAIIVACFSAGCGILALLIGLLASGTVDDPGFPFLLTMIGLGCAVLTLLMLVMRQLLKQATNLRTDMDAVI